MKVLSEAIYTFKNSFYSNIEGGVLNETISFSLIEMQIITRDESTIDSMEQFKDKRTKEIYQITIAEKIHENIISKGFLAVDMKKLPNLDNLSKRLYLLLEKNRNYEKTIVRPIKVLAEKISLSFERKNILRTFTIIETSLTRLKEEKLIDSFYIKENKSCDKVELIVNYNENHNKIKKNDYYLEKYFRERETLNKENDSLNTTIDKDYDINILLNLYPKNIQNMETLNELLNEAVKKYGFDYVRDTVEYVVSKSPKNYGGYTKKALDENWAEEYISLKELKRIKAEDKKEKVAEKVKDLEPPKRILTFENFPNLPEDKKKDVENKAYIKFLKESEGNDSRLLRNIFKTSGKIFISEELENVGLA